MDRRCELSGPCGTANANGVVYVTVQCPKHGPFQFPVSEEMLRFPDEVAAPIVVEEPVVSAEPDETWTVKQLKSFCRTNEIDFYPAMKGKKLLGLIEAWKLKNAQEKLAIPVPDAN